MAGHSQFSNIKHRKYSQDAKRSQKFAKLIREITVSIKGGLPYPELNSRLRSAILAARKKNLPKYKIETAIKNATKSIIRENYEEIQYGVYGPSNTALIVHALTNNRKRTISEMRCILSHIGGNFRKIESINYLFNYVGLISYKVKNVSFDDLFDYGVKLEVLNIEENNKEKLYFITCAVNNFNKVRDAFYKKFGEPEFARLSWQPKEIIKVTNKELIDRLSKLINDLKDNDDVQYVECNFVFVNNNFID